MPSGVTAFLVTSLAVAFGAAVFVWLTMPAATTLPMGERQILPQHAKAPRRRWFPAVARVTGWLVTGAAAALLLAFILWMTLPRILNVQALIVLTGSMEPALPVGSVAFVEKSGASEVENGDIITFARPEQARRVLVTHRVIEVVEGENGTSFRTQGDANNTADDWLVPETLVMGEVRTVVPYVGYVTDKVRGRNAFLALMVIPGALIIGGEIGKIRRELRRMRAAA